MDGGMFNGILQNSTLSPGVGKVGHQPRKEQLCGGEEWQARSNVQPVPCDQGVTVFLRDGTLNVGLNAQ